jgi:hypothetical protein
MDQSTPGRPRRRTALAAGAAGIALCAALAGCTSSSNSGQPSSAVATNAPNGPGQWTAGQKADALSVLTGPPPGQGSAQATCIIGFASANLSWQQFQSYVSFLDGQGGIATPNGEQGAVVSQISNFAVKCGAQNLEPGFASPNTTRS